MDQAVLMSGWDDNTSVLVVIVSLVLLLSGCDIPQRVSQLEKQNGELKAALEKQRSGADYDLQPKCAHNAKEWFNDHWAVHDKDTILLGYTNHHNKSDNNCYALIEYHFRSGINLTGWANDMTLWNVNENSKLAAFTEEHYGRTASIPNPESKIITCEVYGKGCKTLQEFEDLTRPYMTN